MMYGYNWGNMMNGGFGTLAFLFWIVVFIDLILAGIWLWQHIRSPKRK